MAAVATVGLLLGPAVRSSAAVGVPAPVAVPGELLRVDFTTTPVGPLSRTSVRRAFGYRNGLIGVERLGPLDTVVQEGANRFFRKTFPAGTCCFSVHGTSLIWRMTVPRTELFLSYRVRFAPGFDGRRGGKLPGLCGGTCNTGGRPPTGTGWSARVMWGEDPTAGTKNVLSDYVYHLDQATLYGDNLMLHTDAGDAVQTRPDWQRIEQHIVLNTPGSADGVIEVWVDGVPVLDRRDLRFRSDPTVGIDRLLFHLFFGGNDPSWAPVRDEWIDIDDVVVATVRGV